MEWRRMQRSWESGTGGPGPEIEMNGGGFLSRPRPCMGCSAWEWSVKWQQILQNQNSKYRNVDFTHNTSVTCREKIFVYVHMPTQTFLLPIGSRCIKSSYRSQKTCPWLLTTCFLQVLRVFPFNGAVKTRCPIQSRTLALSRSSFQHTRTWPRHIILRTPSRSHTMEITM